MADAVVNIAVEDVPPTPEQAAALAEADASAIATAEAAAPLNEAPPAAPPEKAPAAALADADAGILTIVETVWPTETFAEGIGIGDASAYIQVPNGYEITNAYGEIVGGVEKLRVVIERTPIVHSAESI